MQVVSWSFQPAGVHVRTVLAPAFAPLPAMRQHVVSPRVTSLRVASSCTATPAQFISSIQYICNLRARVPNGVVRPPASPARAEPSRPTFIGQAGRGAFGRTELRRLASPDDPAKLCTMLNCLKKLNSFRAREVEVGVARSVTASMSAVSRVPPLLSIDALSFGRAGAPS
ncbi:hypothetical protein T492DRAFT_839464 [Pavlovales sp. CCMP2436]|nr:hypothetical protein T492DRAFT_839464 [Pavlovales sp. CCMP2436]